MSKGERQRARKSRKEAGGGSRGKTNEANQKALKRDEAPGEHPEPSPEGRPTMQSDTPHADDRRDPGRRNLEDGVAVIVPVTDAMMDHAAHEAAARADGIAQGTIALDRAAAGIEGAARNAAEASDDKAPAMVETATDASDGTVRAAEAAAQDASRAVDRGAEAARDALSAPADALTQYNAKVVEMVRSNLASTTALFTALVQARSVPEALSLNADHLRRQMETLTTQGRELATLTQRIALDAMQPFKGATDR